MMKVMSKPKRDIVSREMRARLMSNRDGKLTTDQWKDMVTEPFVKLLILMIPLSTVFILPIGRLALRNWWLFALIALVVIFLPIIARARRYARAPLQFATLYAGHMPRAWWMFWQPEVLYDENGKAYKFAKRLTPYAGLEPNEPYLVYYLREPEQQVMLSLAPAEHPDAEKWQPTKLFHQRQGKRSSS
jgi:hypothetical protein